MDVIFVVDGLNGLDRREFIGVRMGWDAFREQKQPQHRSNMTTHLSPTSQRVQDILRDLGYPFTVLESEIHTRTAQEAADRVGCGLGQIVKSLIFRGSRTGKPILVLTSGTNRVDEGRIREYAAEAISRADPEFVRTVTGFAIGGVPPVGHNQPMETYLDQDLLQYGSIWAAGGTPNSVFELTPAALQQMTSGKVCAVRVESD